MNNNNFGKNLKWLRAEGNETQELLAMKLKVDKSLISHWEHERRMPDEEMLKSIATHYGVSVEELFADTYESDTEVTDNGAVEFFCFYGLEHCPLPKIDFEKTRAFGLFKEAMRIDRKSETGKATKDEIVEMARNYWEAFDEGILEAGVNLLGHLFQTELNIKNSGVEKHGLDEKIRNLIEGLQLHEHPAGDYYDALCLMESLNGYEGDEETNFDEGIKRLYELAEDGNEYAQVFVENIESVE